MADSHRNDTPPTRVAFTNMGGASWLGGTHYLKNLFTALHSLEAPTRPEIVLVNFGEAAHETLLPLVDHQIDFASHLSGLSLPQRLVNRFQASTKIVVEKESSVSKFFQNQTISALFSLNEMGPRLQVPLLGWIPDFQHIHLPEMFSAAEIASRNQSQALLAERCDRIVLSSHDACLDFERFAPQAKHKSRVLPFVACTPDKVYDADPRWVCDFYNLPERFIYLPNQFWKHKNHQVVIDALVLLHSRYPEIVVVCTGNTNDPRNPGYFAQLLPKIAANKLRNQFIVLGMVPQDHIAPLMRQALAVLQPSRFEGWSTIVEEVKSLGKGIVLSDLAVHREQNPPDGMFFKPEEPEELAECLIKIYRDKMPGPDAAAEASARQHLPLRINEFGRQFMNIVTECTVGARHPDR